MLNLFKRIFVGSINSMSVISVIILKKDSKIGVSDASSRAIRNRLMAVVAKSTRIAWLKTVL